MFMLNDKPLGLDTAFVCNEIQYPANWLRLATAEERAAIGITEQPDPESYDDRFYWGIGNPKDIEQVRSMLISQVKATAASLLSPTDWKVIRAAEAGSAIDLTLRQSRESIRMASNTNEAKIAACSSVEEMAALQFTWPAVE